MLPEEVVESYMKAGRIASETRDYARGLVKEGASLLDICSRVEENIIKKGGRPAFPCNVDVNEVAAHYSSPIDDARVIPRGAIVKVDLGVHVEGYIADTALTVCLNPAHNAMVRGVEEALKRAIETIRPRAKNGDIGGAIESTIESYGFRPIRNLSGHQMNRFVLHTGKSIPNVQGIGFERISEDEVYAVEPFLTTKLGKGQIKSEEREVYIHRFHKDRNPKSPNARMLLDTIQSQYKSLPFSERWLRHLLPKEELDEAFSELLREKCIVGYPVLVEAAGQIVAQAEHTLIVTGEGCVVTTV